MTLNVAKPRLCILGRKPGVRRDRAPAPFQQRIDHYKYLGLILTEYLEWDKAIKEIQRKANRALVLLNYRAVACGGLHFNTYSMSFNQLVQSTIMCNACVWGHTDSKSLANIQINALRFILGVGKACPIAGLFGVGALQHDSKI